MMVEWTMMENLVIMRTMYMTRDENLWTHENGGRRRQIDFCVVDQGARREAENSEACNDVGIGNDHRAVKLELAQSSRSAKKKYGPRKKGVGGKAWGWAPADKREYQEKLNEEVEKLFEKDGTRNRTASIDERCKDIEATLTQVAEACRAKAEETGQQKQEATQALKGLIVERREARRRGDAKAVGECSKKIQREATRSLRKKKRERVAKILSEFKGLGHIADARNNGVRNKLGSVKDCSGASRT